MQKIEIMAPVGSFEALSAAINAGCDSIYFGVEQLNMRARAAHNFTLEELKEVVKLCEESGVRSYLTMNTLLYQHDLVLMRKILDAAKAAGISAVIVQDIAAIQYARSIGLSLHASTQLSISNYEAVKFYAQFADTLVLAREVDMEMMREICKKIEEEWLKGPGGALVRIEVFVHGALCIAQSGRCQMSLITNNTSAQRGACLQECRKKYRVTDEETGTEMVIEDGFVLSPTDLCCLPFLDKLAETGVSVFKIEGRGKSADYVSKVVQVYREARDAILEGTFTKERIEAWMTELKSVYNRGFSEGYYLGRKLPEWSGSSGSKATDEKIYAGEVSHYFAKAKIAELNLLAHELKKGDEFVVIGKTTGAVFGRVESMMKDGAEVEECGRQGLATIPLVETVRKNDKIYLLKKRALNAL
ncbi:MAG: peptidase U32 family protein [Candidatus Gracilibacteria bacterium]|jgi:putative protease